jgi:iron(III) transport system ATP-binding protein
VPAEKRNLGLVFQSYALWPHRTVFDNVAYGLKLRKVAVAETRLRVESALGNLGLGHLGERLPHQLSGGQQQRVAIARALVYNPPVILMDEPLSNLDAKLREEARAWLRELILKMRLSALVVTHDQNEAMAMSDRILLLNNGVIEQQGVPQELYGHPNTLFVADFMGSNNRIEGTVVERRGDAAKIAGDGWQLWGQDRGGAAEGVKATGMIRLERVRLAAGEAENTVRLPLVTSMFLGDRWEYLFHRSDLRLRAYGPTALATGDQWLEIPQEGLWVF